MVTGRKEPGLPARAFCHPSKKGQTAIGKWTETAISQAASSMWNHITRAIN